MVYKYIMCNNVVNTISSHQNTQHNTEVTHERENKMVK